MPKMLKFILLSVSVVSVLTGIFFFDLKRLTSRSVAGEVVFEYPQGGDFSIPSTSGNFDTVQYRGKTLFVFFGFARCPSVCPVTLARLKRMLEKLTPQEREKAVILFVSVDPDRDSLKDLADKLKGFGSQFIGATDLQDKLKIITKKFGASFSIVKSSPNETNYFIDHTDPVYVINSRGEWVNSIPFDATTENYVAAFRSADEAKPAVKEHKVILKNLASNSTCDAAIEVCRVEVSKEFWVEMSLGPRPVKTQRAHSIYVKSSSDDHIPVEVDIIGLNLDMGFIRPELKFENVNEYEGKMYLPSCAVEKMKWQARVIIKDKANNYSTVSFIFSTDQN